MKIRVAFISLLFAVVGFAVLVSRVHYTGVELLPTLDSNYWTVEARVFLPKKKSNLKLELEIPQGSPGYLIYRESFSSSGLATEIVENKGIRKIIWTGQVGDFSSDSVKYTAMLSKGTTGLIPSSNVLALYKDEALFEGEEVDIVRNFISTARDYTANDKEFVKVIRRCVVEASCPFEDIFLRFRESESSTGFLMASILNMAGVDSVLVSGFEASSDPTKRMRFWLRSQISGVWQDVFFNKTERLKSSEMIFWSWILPGLERGVLAADKVVKFAMVPVELKTPMKALQQESTAWRYLSLRSLPIPVQATYRLLLLVPLGALFLTIFRSFFGFQTFGTFMPILLALSFRETGLTWGLILLHLVVVFGLLVRAALSKLHLLHVPRVSTSLSLVVILMIIISKVSYELNFAPGLNVTLFPIVIVTMLIERMSISIEESGTRKTYILFFWSVFVASIGHLLMSNKIVEYWVFNFPEVNLFFIALTMLLGRYTGYRVSELIRFRHMVD